MKDLNALYKKIRQIDEEQRTDLDKYRLGQMSLTDFKKSEAFKRMSNQERMQQGLISLDDYLKNMTPMDKYQKGLINKDELDRSQAIQPVYPESLLGLGGAIRGGVNLAQKGITGARNLFGKQTAKPPEVPVNPDVPDVPDVPPEI